jgi:hypothetical protein|tara:strand:- start:1669 stop:1815 length:147 start_codon:yes stop_codon:yes gene_type:complete
MDLTDTELRDIIEAITYFTNFYVGINTPQGKEYEVILKKLHKRLGEKK